MKRLILLTCVMSLLFVAAKAQTNPIDSKLKKGNDAINGAGASAKGTLNSLDSAKQTGKALFDQGSSMLGFKKKPSVSIVISLPGANRAKLRSLSDIIKTCHGAKDVDFDDSKQNITVGSYKGTVNELIADLEKKTPLVTDSNTTSSKADNTATITLQ